MIFRTIKSSDGESGERFFDGVKTTGVGILPLETADGLLIDKDFIMAAKLKPPGMRITKLGTNCLYSSRVS
jgi:hypothetical protein